MRRLVSLTLAVLLASTASSIGPAQASTRLTSHAGKQDWNKQIGWVTVPVLYVTDRHLNIQSGELDYSEQQGTDGLSYGVKNITIPLTAGGHDISALIDDSLETLEDSEMKGCLAETMLQSGTFLDFKAALSESPEMETKWKEFHKREMEQTAKSWLKEHKVLHTSG